MRKLTIALTTGAAALTLGVAGIAAAHQHGGERGMAAADANDDGIISLDEAQAHADERFTRMDANADGQLTMEDRDAHRAQRFAEADTDGNGELSPAEMTAAREAREAERAQRRAERQARMFERADTDGSGGLSEAEMIAAREARGEAREGRRGQRGEMRRGGRRGGDRAMRMLRRADTNQDQIVSKAEFDAAVEARFARVDSDGSGTITAEEREAAREARREGRRGQRR